MILPAIILICGLQRSILRLKKRPGVVGSGIGCVNAMRENLSRLIKGLRLYPVSGGPSFPNGPAPGICAFMGGHLSKIIHRGKSFIGNLQRLHSVQTMFNCARMNVKPVWALIVGIAITYFSGFLTPLFPERTVDVLQWGSPFPYLHLVATFPGPAFVDWPIAVIDCLIWTIIAFVILYFIWPRGPLEEKCVVKK